MKKNYKELVSTIEYLKESYPNIPQHAFDVLNDVKGDLEKQMKKKRCKHCDRYEHYDETNGIWLCEQCDKKSDNAK